MFGQHSRTFPNRPGRAMSKNSLICPENGPQLITVLSDRLVPVGI